MACEGVKIWKTARRVSCAAGGKSLKQKLRHFGLAQWISLFLRKLNVFRESDFHFFRDSTPSYRHASGSSRQVASHSIADYYIPCRASSTLALESPFMPTGASVGRKRGDFSQASEDKERLEPKADPYLCFSNPMHTFCLRKCIKRSSHNVKSAWCSKESTTVSTI
jgi:hypothetical protein